jgi:ABC-type sugar transport system ATPase subunit
VNTSAATPARVPAPPILRARGIRKSYGHVEALRGADLEVLPGEIHALLGDNGAGKSTLVKALSGVVTPDAGTIEFRGREVAFATPREAQDAGVETVYQDLALAGSLNPGENVFLGREPLASGLRGRLRFVDRAEMRRRTAAELELLGINLPSIDSNVETMSGGQRQAVAIARAAIWGSSMLIMDEPTAALGVVQTEFVQQLMRRVRDEKGLSILLISHNMPEVFAIADRVTIMRLGRSALTCPVSELTTERLLAVMAGLDHLRPGEPT